MFVWHDFWCSPQVALDNSKATLSTEDSTCALNVPAAVEPPHPPSLPGAGSPIAITGTTISIALVDKSLKAAVSVQTDKPITGFQFDVVDSSGNAVSITGTLSR